MVSLEQMDHPIFELTSIFAFLMPCFLLFVKFIIDTTEWITAHNHFLCLVYIAMSYVLLESLSTTMTIWRKDSAKDKPLEKLRITDVDYIEPALQPLSVESLDAGCVERFKVKCGNFFQFYEYNFGYKTLAEVGIVFMIIATLMLRLSCLEGKSSEDCLVPIFLLVLGAIYISAVFVIANDCRTYIREMEYYEPFSDKVNVPMKVMFAKILATCINEGLFSMIPVAIGYFFLLCGVYIFTNLTEMSEAVRHLSRGHFSGIVTDYVMRGIFIAYFVFGILLIYQRIKTATEKVKLNFLDIMEQNWQRNLHAAKYLLPEVEETSLEELVKRLKKIRMCPTPRQYNILLYLCLPLWKPKKGFCERN